MAEVYNSVREGLLLKLASTIGVTPEVAKSKATLIADSYASMRRYVDNDDKAKQMMIADSEKIFGLRLNDEILNNVLKYVGKFEGNIASDKYIANERANFPKLEAKLEDRVAVNPKFANPDEYSHKPKKNYVSERGDGQYAGRRPNLGILKSNAGYTLALPRTLRGRIISLVAVGAIAAAPLVYNYRATLYDMYQRFMGRSAVVQQAEPKQPEKAGKGWVFNQETDEHRQFRAGKIKYSDLSEDAKKWFSLQPSHVTSYKGKDLKSILLGVKVDGRWILGLNPTKSPDTKGKVQQVILYKPGENKLYIKSSVNYEKKPTKVAIKEAKVEPKVEVKVEPEVKPQVVVEGSEVKPEVKVPESGIPFKPEHLTVHGVKEDVSAVKPEQKDDKMGGIPFVPEHSTVYQ